MFLCVSKNCTSNFSLVICLRTEVVTIRPGGVGVEYADCKQVS